MRQPVFRCVGVILVVARHEILPVFAFELSQWRELRAQLRHHTIGHIARNGNNVGLKFLHRFNNGLNQWRSVVYLTNMQIRNLHNPHTVQCCG